MFTGKIELIKKHVTGEMTNKPDLDGFGKQNRFKQPTSMFVQKTPDV